MARRYNTQQANDQWGSEEDDSPGGSFGEYDGESEGHDSEEHGDHDDEYEDEYEENDYDEDEDEDEDDYEEEDYDEDEDEEESDDDEDDEEESDEDEYDEDEYDEDDEESDEDDSYDEELGYGQDDGSYGYVDPLADPRGDGRDHYYDEPEEGDSLAAKIMLAACLCCLCLSVVTAAVVLGLMLTGSDGDGESSPSGNGNPVPLPTRAPVPPTDSPTRAPVTPTLPPPSASPTISPVPSVSPSTDPTRVPTTTPSLSPSVSASPTEPIPDELILTADQDTYIFLDGNFVDENFGRDETMLVQKGVPLKDAIANAVSYVTFDLERLPLPWRIENRYKSAILTLTHVVPSNAAELTTDTYTIARLPSTRNPVESFHGNLYRPTDEIYGPSFPVNPTDTAIDIDVSELLFEQPPFERRHSRQLQGPDTQLFLLIENLGPEQDLGGDRFYTRDSPFPPTLNITLILKPPTPSPTMFPTLSNAPSISSQPSAKPSLSSQPTAMPTLPPTRTPQPSSEPTVSAHPSMKPSISGQPTNVPSAAPSLSKEPSAHPTKSAEPSTSPSTTPSTKPTTSAKPSVSAQPSDNEIPV